MNVARIENGIVINVEVAEREWVDAHPEVVPCDGTVTVGMAWTAEGGFTPAPLTPPSEESLAWAAANGDTSWQDALSARADQ